MLRIPFLTGLVVYRLRLAYCSQPIISRKSSHASNQLRTINRSHLPLNTKHWTCELICSATEAKRWACHAAPRPNHASSQLINTVCSPLYLYLNFYSSSSFNISQISSSHHQINTSKYLPFNSQATMPRIPNARNFSRSPGMIGGVAVTASAAPLLFLVPGFEERLSAQAAKWGPRWNRAFSHVTPHIEHHAAKIESPMQKGVKKVEPPLKRAAL